MSNASHNRVWFLDSVNDNTCPVFAMSDNIAVVFLGSLKGLICDVLRVVFKRQLPPNGGLI